MCNHALIIVVKTFLRSQINFQLSSRSSVSHLWNEVTIWWNEVAKGWNEVVWNEVVMERSGRNSCEHVNIMTYWQNNDIDITT